MSNTVTTTLREALNEVTGLGILQEKELNFKIKNGKAFVYGHITIKTGEKSFVKFKVMANKLTETGAESKLYKAYQTIDKEYRSLVDTMGDVEQADILSITGKLSMNDFPNKNTGEMISSLQLDAKFINRLEDRTVFDINSPTNVLGAIEMYYKNIYDETKKEDDVLVPTGGKFVEGIIPIYKGKVFPAKFYLPADDDGIEFYEDMDKGSTLKAFYFVHNVTEVVMVGGSDSSTGYGKKSEAKPRRNSYTRYVLCGADSPYEEYDEDQSPKQQLAFGVEAIKLAMQERENMLVEKKEGGKLQQTPQQPPQQPTGYSGYSAQTTPSNIPTMTFEDDDELPF